MKFNFTDEAGKKQDIENLLGELNEENSLSAGFTVRKAYLQGYDKALYDVSEFLDDKAIDELLEVQAITETLKSYETNEEIIDEKVIGISLMSISKKVEKVINMFGHKGITN